MNNNGLAIDLLKVSKSFKTASKPVRVLKEVDLKVEREDFLIIFGPSGCGKSTLLHVILGLETPDSGSMVKVLGETVYSQITTNSLSEDRAADFRKVNLGMVYQQTYWIKSRDVLYNVAFPLLLKGEAQAVAFEKAGRILNEFGMEPWASYIPTELSSGQQQKVNLARALVTEPKILIADEPTGNLDYQSGQELMETLVMLNKKGKTIIMVTHDLEYLPYAKRAAQMLDGKIDHVYTGVEKSNILKGLRTKKPEMIND